VLDRIRNSARATELLADVFDFDLTRTDHGEEVRLASGGELRPVAGDASGGTFFVCDGGPVLYASSEGDAGILAADLTAAVELVIGMPTWHDVVSSAPDLDAMRAAFESSHTELRTEFEPEIDQHQAEVSAELGLDRVPADELLARLRTSLADTAHVLLNEDGDAYDSLSSGM
jgi:hypothetical protein